MEDLIVAKSLPVSQSDIRAIRARGDQRAKDARSLICTPESLFAVKAARAEVQKEYDALEEGRKALKSWAMEEYKRFEVDYKAASKGYVDALALYSKEIQETEESIKKDCEDGLRDYFAELCAVRHLDWLTYERAGIKVDMASAKAKTPKRLREQLAAFVKDVFENVSVISGMNNAGEMMVEYQRCLNFADAYDTVQERHRLIKEQKAAQEARKAEQAREAEMVHRVETLATPVVVEVPEKNPDDVFESFTYTVFNVKRYQLWRIREFLNMEGIIYE